MQRSVSSATSTTRGPDRGISQASATSSPNSWLISARSRSLIALGVAALVLIAVSIPALFSRPNPAPDHNDAGRSLIIAPLAASNASSHAVTSHAVTSHAVNAMDGSVRALADDVRLAQAPLKPTLSAVARQARGVARDQMRELRTLVLRSQQPAGPSSIGASTRAAVATWWRGVQKAAGIDVAAANVKLLAQLASPGRHRAGANQVDRSPAELNPADLNQLDKSQGEPLANRDQPTNGQQTPPPDPAADPIIELEPNAQTQPSNTAVSSSKAKLVRLTINLSGVDRSSEAYSRFKTWVDRAANGDPGWDFRASDAVILFLITRQTRYCTLAVELVEAKVVAAETAIAKGERPPVAGNSYLEIGPMLSDLAHVYQDCQAQTTTAQRRRWANYAEQAVWNVWNYEDAQWGGRSHPWTGWSVDNPGNNYHFSFLKATMYWALASGSRNWYVFLRDNKLPKLQAYYARIPGGGSLEGTGYGTAQRRLLEIYRVWRDSTGQNLAISNTHARKTIDYWVHATLPTRNYFAPIGDQSRVAVPELYDYHRHLMLAARDLTSDVTGRNIASWWLGKISVPRMNHGTSMRHDMLLTAGTYNEPPAALHYIAQGTGHVFARTDWGTDAMWMAFAAGPFNESHAHQDQGSFTLFSRGKWLAVTQNIWSRNGLQQGTSVHNVVRFERSNADIRQCTAPMNDRIVHQCRMTASSMTVTPISNGALSINADLTPVYGSNPAMNRWNRKVNFAGRKLIVLDQFSIPAGTSATFQLNVPTKPTIVDSRTVIAGDLRMRVLQPANAAIRVLDWSTVNTDESGRGWRIDVSGSRSTYQVELSER